MTLEGVIEILTAVELAQRLKVKSSWVIDASQPARNSDPLPVIKIGRHNRYGWNSKSLSAWLHTERFEIILKPTRYRSTMEIGVMRWSSYKIVDGKRKRTQPTHILAPASIKKEDAKGLAAEYFAKVHRSRTVQAGASLSNFVKLVFFPSCEGVYPRTRRPSIASSGSDWSHTWAAFVSGM
jgi:hypothetical protein